MIRKALIVGIDYYENASPLFGCVNDAHSIESVLDTNSDGGKNFQTKLITSGGPDSKITRKDLKNSVEELFEGKTSVALFYFAGHGGFDNKTGGYLQTSECEFGDSGMAMEELLMIANKSQALNKIIILDCCHAGATGELSMNKDFSTLSDGMTILTAASANQYAKEENGTGVFTKLLVDALHGSAANLLGQVTPGSAYAHIDQAIGVWGQRPIFRTNIKKFMPLRVAQPPIPLADLKMLTELFINKWDNFQLDPTYEPERSDEQKAIYPNPIEENTRNFKILQKFNRVNLVVPVDAPHMWHAAMNSKSCKLTTLGERYWDLVNKNFI
ncbi:MAG: caspase family protein [Bacteroidota bacterium]